MDVAFEAKEARAVPCCTGDGFRDGSKRLPVLAIILEAIIEHDDGVADTVPIAHQPGARRQLAGHGLRLCSLPCPRRNLPQQRTRAPAQSAELLLLQLVADPEPQQFRRKRRSGRAEPAHPLRLEALGRKLGQPPERQVRLAAHQDTMAR